MKALSSFRLANAGRKACQAICLALCCAMQACTFPDVTYADGGSVPCTVSSNCANKASACGKQAQTGKASCEQQSCNGSPCPTCTMQFEGNVAVCVGDCEACGKLEGCANATDDCQTIVNAP